MDEILIVLHVNFIYVNCHKCVSEVFVALDEVLIMELVKQQFTYVVLRVGKCDGTI
jgi:hypothetical protein